MSKTATTSPEYAARDAANAPYENAFSSIVTVGLVKDGDRIVERRFIQDRRLSFAGNTAYKMRQEGLDNVQTYGLVPLWRDKETKTYYIPDFAVGRLLELITYQEEQRGDDNNT